jgi:ribonucleoside-diphosphate reductase alpha chain
VLKVEKRNGKVVDFEKGKIEIAVSKAMKETENGVDEALVKQIALEALDEFTDLGVVNIEQIQDFVEIQLMKTRPEVARKYIIYREERARLREQGWNMTDLQRDIYEKKYRYDAETFEDFLERVSGVNNPIKKAIKDKKFMPAGRILAGRGLDKLGKKITLSNCFVAGSKVITKRGLINIEDVKVGDYVITHDNTWQLVNNVMSRDYDGDLYKIKTEYMYDSIICTPNHRFFTSSGWVRADRLVGKLMDRKYYNNSHFIKTPTLRYEVEEYTIKLSDYIDPLENEFVEVDENNMVVLGTRFIGGNDAHGIKFGNPIYNTINMNKEMQYLFGRWIGDGSITRRRGKRNHSIFQIVFNSNNEREAFDRCRNIIIENLKYEPLVTENIEQNTLILRIENPFLAEFVAKYFGTNGSNKRIPKELIGSLDLVLGILDSDGCILKTGAIKLVMNNEKLLYDIRETLMLNGVIVRKPQKIKQSLSNETRIYTAYKLHISTPFSKEKLIGLMEKSYSDNRVNHILNNDLKGSTKYLSMDGEVYTRVEYTEIIENVKTKVYNLSVENSNSYTVNGLVVHNCYVMPKVEDNIESIFDTAKYLARTYSYGGGCGLTLSKLRPRGARVNNAASTTTGAVSFMDLYSLVTGLIGMRGRRGALMLNMDVNHPDIGDFIDVKNDLSKITYANISVNIDDKFMEAVKNDEEYELYFKVEATGEEISKKIRAKDLFRKLAKNNWDMAEPGILYTDKINSWHLMSEDKSFEFAGVNPCAEETLPAFGSCNLASINLSEFVKNPFTKYARFEFEKFSEMVRNGIMFLNEVLDENMKMHPIPEQRQMSYDLRQIGLGIMGLADMFIKLGIKYGSSESINIIHQIGRTMINEALRQSAMLAKKDGPFPRYNADAILNSPFLLSNADSDVLELIKEYGLRNSQLLTIPPTGSISTLIGCSNGVEPIFQVSYTRKSESLHHEDTYYKVFTPIVKEYMDLNAIYREEDLPEFIVTTTNLNYKDRIEVQSTWQQYIDASISSTVNVPNEFTIEEVEDLYIYAWEKGLKGITIYRDGCARSGILITNKDKTSRLDKIDELQREIDQLAAEQLKEDPDTCPMCGGKLNHSGGCAECQDCGYSPCSI